MFWNLDLKGVIVLACNAAGIGVIPAALSVLVSIVTISGRMIRRPKPRMS